MSQAGPQGRGAAPRLPRGAGSGTLERVPVCFRGSPGIRSAWRLAVETDEGPGAVVLAEAGEGESWWRGEGVFLGFSQAELAAAWDALRPPPSEEPFHVPPAG